MERKYPQRFTFPSPGFSDYWQSTVGKKMLNKLGYVPDRESVESYSSLLFESDDLADKIVLDVFEKNGYKYGHDLLNRILNNGLENESNVPAPLVELFNKIDTVPTWLDERLLEVGSAFCRRTGRFGFIVLRNYCLMGGYESAAINKPLIYTGALKKGAARRMAETLDFWVNVTAENALQRFSVGFASAIKVRMIHAFSRAYIFKTNAWKDEAWGVPINQGDMVATNLGFSQVFLEGIRKVGFKPSEEEIKGLFHFWKYIGHLLGIPVEYLPDDEKQAIEKLYKWTISQPMADDDTRTLALSLMDEPILASYPKYKWQKKLLIKTHLGYNYFFLNNRACQTMGLPPTRFRYIPYIAGFVNRINECFISSGLYYNYVVRIGRKRQEKVRMQFMRGHALNRK